MVLFIFLSPPPPPIVSNMVLIVNIFQDIVTKLELQYRQTLVPQILEASCSSRHN